MNVFKAKYSVNTICILLSFFFLYLELHFFSFLFSILHFNLSIFLSPIGLRNENQKWWLNSFCTLNFLLLGSAKKDKKCFSSSPMSIRELLKANRPWRKKKKQKSIFLHSTQIPTRKKGKKRCKGVDILHFLARVVFMLKHWLLGLGYNWALIFGLGYNWPLTFGLWLKLAIDFWAWATIGLQLGSLAF